MAVRFGLGDRFWHTSTYRKLWRQSVELPSTRKSMGHTVGELSWKTADFCVFSVSVKEKCFEARG
jgi:hypothetical protein